MLPVGNRDLHNPQDRSRWTLAAVWHHTDSDYCAPVAPWPCDATSWFYRVSKKPSMKADLTMYSHVLDISGRCMSVSLVLFIKLDFISCANWDSFCKSSHIYWISLFPVKIHMAVDSIMDYLWKTVPRCSSGNLASMIFYVEITVLAMCNSWNMGMRDLPEMYAWGSGKSQVHIRITTVYVTLPLP